MEQGRPRAYYDGMKHAIGYPRSLVAALCLGFLSGVGFLPRAAAQLDAVGKSVEMSGGIFVAEHGAFEFAAFNAALDYDLTVVLRGGLQR